jgi:hypothetical protein
MIDDLQNSRMLDDRTFRRLKHWHRGEEYLKVAGAFVKHTPPQSFRNFLKEQLDPPDLAPSTLHRSILDTRLRAIVTTNFDKVFEFQGRSLSPLIYPHCFNDVDSFREDFFFAKLHGCVSQAYDPENIVLTEKNYADLRLNSKYQSILRSVFSSHTFLTVGFSLRDPDFLGLIGDFKEIFGSFSPTVFALMREDAVKSRKPWEDLHVEPITYKDHRELPRIFADIQKVARTDVLDAPIKRRLVPLRRVTKKKAKSAKTKEQEFLEAASLGPLRLGRLDLQCQLFPEQLWNGNRRLHLYADDPEAERQVVLKWNDSVLPKDTLETLVREIQYRIASSKSGSLIIPQKEFQVLTEVERRLTQEGSNAYPRLVGSPEIVAGATVRGTETLQVPIGPSRYGVALIEERRLKLPTALSLRKNHILNSLAVRVAFVYERKGEKWIEFHQRKGGANATYKNAWDVSAAGYVDPLRHRDPDKKERVSPWLACAYELAEELGIRSFELPHRDHYQFLGLGRNWPTGQLDLLAFCEAAIPLDTSRPRTARVRTFGRCRLNPESVAAFVLSRRCWVPTALLTLVLTLEAFGFPRGRIRRALSPLAGKLNLQP